MDVTSIAAASAVRFPRLVFVLLILFFASVRSDAADSPLERYQRAERFLPQNASSMVLDNDVQATWIGHSSELWYKLAAADGWRFMVADAATGQRREAFDHDALAAALGRATGETQAASRLPLSSLLFPQGSDGPVVVTAAGRIYECRLPHQCREQPNPKLRPDRAYAPGGRRALFANGYDLWVQDLAGGAERALTTDGSPSRAYAALPGVGAPLFRARRGIVRPPIGLFSPDGRRFLTYRLDESRSPNVTLVEHAPTDPAARPKAHSYPASYVGDPPGTAQLMIFDLESGASVRVDHPPSFLSLFGPIALAEAKWAPDESAVYFTDYADLFRTRSLFRADASSGRSERLISDEANTNQYSFVHANWMLLGNGDILWPSERSGWQHIYRYDRAGRLRNAVTEGKWLVRELISADERRGIITFSAGGREGERDPYLRHIYRAKLSSGGVRLLTPEDADHEVRVEGPRQTPTGTVDVAPAFSAGGDFFIDAFSRIDRPTETVVRRASDGGIVMALATARYSLAAANVSPPERFEALAADGKTKIYGILMKPPGFDPGRKYPVIDTMYAGPQSIFVPKRFGWEMIGTYGRDLAELGFVVFIADGRGLPWRSRAYLDEGYGKLGKAGFLEDHVAALKQLSRTRPWLDIERVGANGYSAGGFASVHAMLDHPDFYKAGVAIAPYDPLINDWVWAARFQGTTDPKEMLGELSYRNAANLKGPLLLMHGDLDDVADPSSTIRIAGALIRENKRFDMLIVPGADHWIALDPYVVKRQWDFFLRHLQGLELPADYRIGAGVQPGNEQ